MGAHPALTGRHVLPALVRPRGGEHRAVDRALPRGARGRDQGGGPGSVGRREAQPRLRLSATGEGGAQRRPASGSSSFRDALSVRSALPALGPRGQSLLGLGQALDALGEETGDEQARADVLGAYRLAAAAFEGVRGGRSGGRRVLRRGGVLVPAGGREPARRGVETALRCLPAWAAERNPLRARPLYALLARLTDRLGRTAEAYGWICQAIETNESLYAVASVADGKAQQDEEGGGWYEAAADLALRSGAAASEALLLAERARARILGESAPRDQPEGSIPAARGGLVSWDQIRNWVDAQPRPGSLCLST